MKRLSFLDIYEYLLALLLLMSASSVYIRMISHNYNALVTGMVGIFSIIGLCVSLWYYNFKKINLRPLFRVVGIYLLLIIPFVLLSAQNRSLSYILTFLVIVPCLLSYLYMLGIQRNLMRIPFKIINIVIVLSILSIFFWLFGAIFHLIPVSGNLVIEWGGVRNVPSYFGFDFEIQNIIIMGKSIVRNSGIFAEAGIYGFVLTVTLVFELFSRQRKGIIITLAVTLLTTTSTSAIIFDLILIVLYMFTKDKQIGSVRILRYVFGAVAFIVVIIITLNILGGKLQTDSFSIRSDDIRAAFTAWQSSKVFGVGLGNTDSIIAYMDPTRYLGVQQQTGFSSGLMLILTQGGLYFTVIYFYPLVYFMRQALRYESLLAFSIPIILVGYLFTAVVQYQPFFIFVLCWFQITSMFYSSVYDIEISK